MGLKKNFIYNIILASANNLFPIIVFPYVSRCIGVYNIGIYNFTDNVILYFTMLSMMGMGILGIREIAAVQNDRNKLNNIFSNLVYLNFVFTLLSITTLIICINCIQQLYQHRQIMYIGCFNIAANFLLLDWMYKGLEKFAYITKRTLLIKTIYVASVFLFIHEPQDYILYYLLTTLSVAINAAVNIWHSRRYVKLVFNDLSLSLFFKPFIKTGTYWIITSLYASSYTIYLGFISTPDQVGLFTTASKLIILIMAVYTAWTNVVLPRSSALLANGQIAGFRDIVEKSTGVLFTFSIPTALLGGFFSQDIIKVLAGTGYEGAAISSTILMPLIFIIGYSQILIIQILMPMKKDYILLRNALIGAITGISLSLYLVPHYLSVGASISWLVSELIVLLLAISYVPKHIHIHIPWQLFLKYLFGNIPTAIICYVLSQNLSCHSIEKILIGGGIVMLYTIFIQYLYLKDPMFIQITQKAKTFLYNHNQKRP